MNYKFLKLIISAAVVIILLILVGCGLYGLDQLNKLEQARNSLRNANHILEISRALFANLDDAETGQRGYLITGDKSTLLLIIILWPK